MMYSELMRFYFISIFFYIVIEPWRRVAVVCDVPVCLGPGAGGSLTPVSMI